MIADAENVTIRRGGVVQMMKFILSGGSGGVLRLHHGVRRDWSVHYFTEDM
jgi:hypothetical protein